MRPYFEKMTDFGNALRKGQIKRSEENVTRLKEVESGIQEAVEKVKNAGLPEEKINSRGQMTVYQRLDYLLDPGSWCPLHTIYNPTDLTELEKSQVNGR